MRFKKGIPLVLAGLLLFFSMTSVMAAEFRVPAEDSGSISISSGQKTRNLYTAGNTVSIDANVEKDLFVAGNVVTISGDIEDDLWAAGNTVIIRGNVGGSAHVVGSNIVVDGEIKEDLFIGGASLTLSSSASIGEDLIIGGGTMNIESPVKGDVYLGGGQAIVNSKISGEIKAEVDELRLGSQAEITKTLTYHSSKEAKIEQGAEVLGEMKFSKKTSQEGRAVKTFSGFFGILTLAFFIKLLAAIVVGLALVYLFRGISEPVVQKSLARFWPSLGLGFAALILTPIACLLFLVTVIGSWLACLGLLAYALMICFSLALAGVACGAWLMKILKKRSGYKIDWQAVVLGVLALKIVGFVPYIGWLAGFVFMLIALGASYKLLYQTVVRGRS